MSKQRTGTQKRSRSADMGQRALAEYEEVERRRYHERLRAEKRGAPMQTTQDRERLEAIATIDEIHAQYLELARTNHCPSCEQIVVWEDSVSKHPDHETLDALAGEKAHARKHWTSPHLEDCSFIQAYLVTVPELAARFHIVIMRRQRDIRQPDGKVTRDLVDVRVPAPGDPDVPS